MVNEELRTPENLAKIGQLRGSGNSWAMIQRELSTEMTTRPSIDAIKSAYEVYSSRSAEVITGDETVKEVLKEAVLDTAGQLQEINNMMREILSQSRTQTGEKIAAANQILKQLSFQQKILETMQSGFDWDKVSKIEYTKVSISNLKHLDEAGHIIILKEPGKEPLSQEFINKIRRMVDVERASIKRERYNQMDTMIIDMEANEPSNSNDSNNDAQDAGQERSNEGNGSDKPNSPTVVQ
jgi:hypothetical protein